MCILLLKRPKSLNYVHYTVSPSLNFKRDTNKVPMFERPALDTLVAQTLRCDIDKLVKGQYLKCYSITTGPLFNSIS